MPMSNVVRAIRIGIPVLSLIVFGQWLFQQAETISLGTIFAFCSACLFTLTLTTALVRLTESLAEKATVPPLPSDTRRERLTAWSLLVLFGVGVSLLQFVAVYVLAHPKGSFGTSFSRLYYRSDVAHYMGIARDWYVQEGNERFRLVFLPLYPLTIRLMTWHGDYFWGAFAAAQLFSLLCLPAAYELFRLDNDRASAMAVARLLFLLPGAAFLRVPMSEGLFLFLTILAVYWARRRRFLWAGLFTALSAFTRSLGVLLLGLLFLEMLDVFVDTVRRDRRAALRLLPGYVGCLLLGCCGTLGYLVINWQTSGSPFTFLTYQRENWNQQFGLFFNTFSYQAEYALRYFSAHDLESVVSLSLPNLLCCFGALCLLYADREQMRVSYLLWALIYFAASIGATWLLSGPRYLAMLFPLALVLRRGCRTGFSEAALEGVLLLAQTAYLLMLALDMSVY